MNSKNVHPTKSLEAFIPTKELSPSWVIDSGSLPEDGSEKLRECLYWVFNGYFGARASLPFSPEGTRGTYVNGLYAHGPSDIYWVPEPDQLWDKERFPTIESIYAHGREWALVASPNLFYTSATKATTVGMRRSLDMKSALLTLEGEVYINGMLWTLQTYRFAMKNDPSCALERIILVPNNHHVPVELFVGIDDSVVNVRASGKSFDLWEKKEFVNAGEGILVWRGKTLKKEMELAIATKCVLSFGEGSVSESPDKSGYVVTGNGPLVIDRFVALCNSRLTDTPFESALASCKKLDSFSSELARHRALWSSIWDRADIVIDGPMEDQKALRYSTYQVMAAMLDTSKISIGLNALSDEGYHGLIFWDMDLYILPLITRTFPAKAKNHLEFRYNSIAAAQEKARKNGYKGTMFPWESAPTGEEGISPWIMLCRTQVHVTGAVAWGVMDYFTWTNDTEFMETKGWVLLAETARFWVSKVSPDGQIKFSCGPDEFNQIVDNNAYTNHIAKHNLLWAAKHCIHKVPQEEINEWLRVSDTILQKMPTADGIIEQFDGFFANHDTQIAKQADVIAMTLVRPEAITGDLLRANYDYYIARCKHLSSLSEPAYAIAAARLGDTQEAYRLFKIGANMDLLDMHHCTDHTGHHSACAALISRIILEGFCTMAVQEKSIVFNAKLPREWRSVEFRLMFKGNDFAIRLHDGESVEIVAREAV